ncbi:MAG: ABC transporter substrate-binding protein [Candidatus Bathyarchaeota archaeon]|nr:ABC transporter substrate-binding protein [Candidatus Bathyarchaeota archaeon]
MKKWLISTLIIAILAIGSVSGVYLYSLNSPQETANTRTIIDSTGEAVEVPTNVQRVVALRPGIVEMLCILGVSDKIVGVDEQTISGAGYGEFNLQLCPELSHLTAPISGKTINVESVIALHPDVVFIGGSGRLSWIEPLKNANLTVVVTHFEEIGNYTRDLGILAEVMDVEDTAGPIITQVQNILDAVDSHVSSLTTDEQVTVYFCSHDAYHAYGCTTFEHAQMVTAKGINVAESITTWLPEISVEQLIVWNPSVMFTLEGTDLASILSDPQLQSISAISNQKVYSIPEAGWDFGSLRAIFAIEWMSSKLYPDLFADIDINQEVSSFYQAVYGMDYTGPEL